jgi:HD-GYP domain-containing protein (c-di-GMP phosphodiesterase class II)
MPNLIIRIAKLINQILDSRLCLIVLVDNHKSFSLLRCSVSNKRVCFLDKKKRIVNRLEKRILNTSSAVFSNNILGVPIIAEDIIGLVIVHNKLNRTSFDKLDQEFLMTLAEQAVIVIKNVQLYEEHQKIILGSINSLVTLLDSQLPERYVHSPYFDRLVTSIAQQMNLSESQIETLRYASIFHDAGKFNIPLQILNKPTKLTKQEFRIIKGHPLKGVQIIKHLEILKPILPIILYHHERYDGKGYPSGLKGKRIPLGARIMALADAFDAMVYGRPYRQRMDLDSAIEEIKKESGKQFDPEVVEAFLKTIRLKKIKKYLQLIK